MPDYFATSVYNAGRLFNAVLSHFAPPRCRCCHAPLFSHRNPYLCSDCVGALPWIGPGACPGCGYPAGPHAIHADGCFRCRGGRLNLTGAASVARYRAGARSLVLAFKFGGETELAAPIAALMGERLRGADFAGKLDLVLPVALHPAKRRQRGFDQAGLLADRVARHVGLPCRSDLMRRAIHTKPQATLQREARLENMTGAFTASGEVEGKRLLLVDDVMTTGATMAECARACRDAGARRVYALTFAR